MATKLNQIDWTKGALTVVVDVEEPSGKEQNIQEGMRRLFDSNDLLFLNQPSLSGEELYEKINEAINSEHSSVTFGPGQTLQFVEMMKLSSLTAERVGTILSRIESICAIIPPSRIQYVFGFYYEVAHPLKEKAGETAEALCRLMSEVMGKVHSQFFLLWGAAFASMDSQEIGFATAVYLASRANVTNVTWNYRGLQSLCYADYYEGRQQKCQRAIDECNVWLGDAADPDLKEFCQVAAKILRGISDREAGLEEEFSGKIDLFPVRANDYAKTGFGPFAKYVHETDPQDVRVVKAKKKYVDSRMEEAVSGMSVEDLEKAVAKMHYKDLKSLSDHAADEEAFTQWLLPRCGYPAEKQTEALKAAAGVIYEHAGKCAADADQRKAETERKLFWAKKEISRGGNYTSLDEFAGRIGGDLRPVNVGALLQPELSRYVLVSGQAMEALQSQSLAVRDTYSAYDCGRIDPVEIAMLKACGFLELTDEETFLSKCAENIR